MNRRLRMAKSERARARRKEVKEVRETTIQKMYKKLKHKRIRAQKLKRKHHDGR